MRARFVKIAALAFAAAESIDRKAEADRGETTVEYCYSTDGETYHGNHTTIDEALRDGIAERYDVSGSEDPSEIGAVWVGQVESPRHVFDSQGDNVIDQIECELYDVVGEHADSFNPSKEERAGLDALISAWCDAHLELTCFSVEKTVEYSAGNSLYDAALADVIADAAKTPSEEAA
ncbi:hypothetical protein NUJ30_08190 [Burkholderia contaminans]|nr:MULTISPECIES: hypothetical protein [Burkholderia]MBD1412906.1 hypothetical protein [Burkholderia contaminans]UXZ68646.1 hypothetical protein NUJ29_08195 [Burkholderia contaminans]UXZ76407.1 hypothetical protein NUJ30_08190 [Burkholderia contaminans]